MERVKIFIIIQEQKNHSCNLHMQWMATREYIIDMAKYIEKTWAPLKQMKEYTQQIDTHYVISFIKVSRKHKLKAAENRPMDSKHDRLD